jgi:hypothetical protein
VRLAARGPTCYQRGSSATSAVFSRRPEENIRHRLQDALAIDDARTLATSFDDHVEAVRLAPIAVFFEDRPVGFFDLQDYGSAVGPHQNHQVTPGADAADADHPQRDIGDTEV